MPFSFQNLFNNLNRQTSEQSETENLQNGYPQNNEGYPMNTNYNQRQYNPIFRTNGQQEQRGMSPQFRQQGQQGQQGQQMGQQGQQRQQGQQGQQSQENRYNYNNPWQKPTQGQGQSQGTGQGQRAAFSNQQRWGTGKQGTSPTQGGGLPQIRPGGMENPFSQALPDGVKLEPLNEETLRNIHKPQPLAAPRNETPSVSQAQLSQLQDIYNQKSFEPQGNYPTPNIAENLGVNGAGTNTDNNFKGIDNLYNNNITAPFNKQGNINNKLKQFIQNERNGSLFYKSLAQSSQKKEYESVLNDLSNSCENRKNIYANIYNKYNKDDYVPVDTKLRSDLKFREGIELAIREESRALRDLGDLYEDTDDINDLKILNSQLFKKVSDISLLHMMRGV